MSLLAKPAAPAVPKNQLVFRDVQALRRVPRQMLDGLFRSWSSAFDLLWQPAGEVTAADRLAALGPDAAELMATSAALVQFLLEQADGVDAEMVAAIQTRLDGLPAFTAHPDGTVTLDA